ncbi:uncharacterized protein B0I36DRAFT_84744 [Microdochium trichocladiopsis]|uniref:Arrestin C-terminal-like domain-containing protein n=1 Tax=Microdochium trichocladiopsis TaxID=1682393 RepID=A0A9P9BSI8_9PEZI|nr:uncharacterized protein B0I36DRAFT_84744 [Microdochium trichocladiopsis]KAH7034845.1 hypothetical protein B0I36DRAFT_84744 [Microdochium trichocladiopsis]
MGSDSTRASSISVDDAPSRPSFFARLAAPLRSRTRNLADFHIRLKEPHRKYGAGDHVRGFVVLSVIKPFRITHLTVALHGHVRAFKSASSATHLSPIDPGTFSADESSNYRYHGNGHVSLFKDEQVLCGEGRLQPSRFEFEFDLVFPEKGLPSSIDFERGTIAYILTATITRPTAITPTTTCETKVSYIEQVDVGSFPAPTERRVVMQTMRRKPKRRRTTTSATTPAVRISPAVPEESEAMSDMDSTRAHDNPHPPANPPADDHVISSQSTGSHHRSPMNSDIQSEFSGESAVSNNSSGRNGDATGDSNPGSKASTADGREITATIEVLKGGSIPGDVVPVRIRVHHNRRLKSMHGVIVTLYRQGRVDYSPPIHMFADLSKEDSERLERDEYYPKSKTGLGGLSLSSAGSCSVFRKDLYQTVNPLIVDPRTLTATINTSVRVPEDAFPSIKGVPGALISFRYYVEVVVDLGGRLSGSGTAVTQQSSRIGGSGGVNSSGVASSLNAHDNNSSGFAGSIVDTDHLRREKGVISVATEITVGTTDSSRLRKSKSAVRPTLTLQQPSTNGDSHYYGDENPDFWQADEQPAADISRTYSRDHRSTTASYDRPPDEAAQLYGPAATSRAVAHLSEEPQTPVYIPRPEVLEQSGLSEKELARRAEQRLLPSQPGPALPSSEAGPSQPVAPSFEDAEATPMATISGTALSVPHAPLSRQSSRQDVFDDGPSAPSLADLSAALPLSAVEDKQELERRRLMEEASAPPEVPEEYAATVAGPSAPPALAPSAPYSLGHNPVAYSPAAAGPSAPPASILTSYQDAMPAHSQDSRGESSATPETHHEDDHDDQYGARAPMSMFAGPSTSAAGPSEPLPRYER